MPDYQPTSRRPIAQAFRKTAGLAVRLCVRWQIHPDVISYASIVASALAGVCFWHAAAHPWLLILAPLLCYVRLWLNMLDGMVALAAGKASNRGEILNDLPDRVSDVIVFAAVAHSGLCSALSGYWAAIFALLTAYVGTLGQAVGVRREFSGMMSKPWRMVTLHIGAWAALGWWLCADGSKSGLWGGAAGADAQTLGLEWTRWGPLTILDWTCLVVIAGCLQTIVVRLKRILSALASKQIRK